MEITTDNKSRTLVSFADLPESARADFDYLDESEHYDYRFVKYRGEWYDVYDFVAITVAPDHRPFGLNVSKDSPLAQWDAIASDSMWSAVVMRFTDNFEGVQIGYATWD